MKLLKHSVLVSCLILCFSACGLFLPRANDFSVNAEPTFDITQTGETSNGTDDAVSEISEEIQNEEPEDICEEKPNKIVNADNMWVYYGSSTPEYAPLTPAEQMAVVGLGFGPNESASCSGTLVKTGWVLTAQHCVQGNSANGIYVLFGADDTNPDMRVNVVEVISNNLPRHGFVELGGRPRRIPRCHADSRVDGRFF